MMSTFESQDGKMPKMSKVPKCQKLKIPKDAKETLVMPAFGSKDAKMTSWEITEAKVASVIS